MSSESNELLLFMSHTSKTLLVASSLIKYINSNDIDYIYLTIIIGIAQ